MVNQVKTPIMASNNIKEYDMSTLKNTSAYTKFIKYVDSDYKTFNELQSSEIKLSNNIGVKTTNFTLQTILLIQGATKGEINKAKNKALNSYQVHALSKTRIDLAFRIAGSEVIKTILKDCNNIKKIKTILKKEVKEDLSQTSLNTYKNKRIVDKGIIKIKPKKAKNKSNKEEQPKKLDAKTFIKKLSNEKLQELSDLVNQEMNLRGQNSEDKDAMTG